MTFMLALMVQTACTGAPAPPAADAAAFAPILTTLDQNHDGVVTLAEYPDAPAGTVDADADGTISANEVRDAVYAVDPATFDPLAATRPHAGSPDSATAADGPLEQALRFLADEQVSRSPGSTAPTAEEIAAAGRAGMRGPEGAAVLGRLRAGGVEVPESIASAGPDSSTVQNDFHVAGSPPAFLRSAGPGGKGERMKPTSSPVSPPAPPPRPRGPAPQGPPQVPPVGAPAPGAPPRAPQG